MRADMTGVNTHVASRRRRLLLAGLVVLVVVVTAAVSLLTRSTAPNVDGWSTYQGVGWSIGHPPGSSIRLPPGHTGPTAQLDTALVVLDQPDCVISITPFSNPTLLAPSNYVSQLLERAQAEAQVSGLPRIRVESRRDISLPDGEAYELRHVSPGGLEIVTYVVLGDIGLAVQPHCTEPGDTDAALSVALGVAATARRTE